MKKLLFTLVAMLVVVAASAQSKALLKQPYQVASVETSSVPQKVIDKQPIAKSIAASVNKRAKKAARRSLAAADLEGEVITGTFLYDYDSEAQKLVPATVSRKGIEAFIEVTGENTIAIYGIDENVSENDTPITATVNPDGTVTIPAGQHIWTYTDGTEFVMANASTDGDFTGTIYDDGTIEINETWYEQYTEGGNTGRNGKYRQTFIAPVNGQMEYNRQDKGVVVTQNVLVDQDEETKEVTVWNFHNFFSGTVIDVTINPDKSFIVEGGIQVVYEHSTLNEIYLWGSAKAGSISDITGAIVDDVQLVSNVGIGYVNNAGRGWVRPNDKFTITLTDGSVFDVPGAETGDLVTPPVGLTTVDMPFSATLYAPNATSYSATVKVGWVENDVYIQGLDKDLPEAWIKGTYDATKGKVTIPVTFTGVFNNAGHFLAGYSSAGPRALTLDYDADANLFTYSATVMIYQSATKTAYNYYYNGFVIGTKPSPTTPPAGLVTKEMPFKGTFVEDAKSEVSGTVKVGRDVNDVYIQGLFASLVPADNEGWIKGTAQTIEGKELIIFSANQYVGNLSNSLATYLTGYVPAQEEGGSPSAGNVVMAYVNDGTYEYYELGNSMILTRFKNSLNPEGYYTTLTIGNAPAAGINSNKSVKAAGDGAWYTIGGQRVAQPTQKGLYIHNGKKVVIK